MLPLHTEALFGIQQQTGAAGGSITLGSAQAQEDAGSTLAFPKYCSEAKVQRQLCQCGAGQMAEATGAKWMRHPLLPARSK